jgi:hypothetical protein
MFRIRRIAIQISHYFGLNHDSPIQKVIFMFSFHDKLQKTWAKLGTNLWQSSKYAFFGLYAESEQNWIHYSD